MRKTRTILAVAILAGLPLVGCTVKFTHGDDQSSTTSTTPAVLQLSKSTLESSLMKTIGEKTNEPASKVTCDGPLKGTVGATQRCVAVSSKDGQSVGLTVTTTVVNGDDIKYGIDFDDHTVGTTTGAAT